FPGGGCFRKTGRLAAESCGQTTLCQTESCRCLDPSPASPHHQHQGTWLQPDCARRQVFYGSSGHSQTVSGGCGGSVARLVHYERRGEDYPREERAIKTGARRPITAYLRGGGFSYT